jgi:hypothetical protein
MIIIAHRLEERDQIDVTLFLVREAIAFERAVQEMTDEEAAAAAAAADAPPNN